MLDIQFIRDNSELVKKTTKDKNHNPVVVDNLLVADGKRRELIQKVEAIREERNKLNELLKKDQTPELIEKSKELKNTLQYLEPELKQIETTYADLMLQVPNVPLEEVPVGKDETGNVVVREWGVKPDFKFKPADHIELGTKNHWLDLERGAKVAGFRGYYLQGDAVLLQLRLMQYALDKFVKTGFTPIIPPVVDNRQAFVNTGHFPWGEKEAYKLA
ncbi:MAG: serine--tRNA ligase, partial [bacterium]